MERKPKTLSQIGGCIIDCKNCRIKNCGQRDQDPYTPLQGAVKLKNKLTQEQVVNKLQQKEAQGDIIKRSAIINTHAGPLAPMPGDHSSPLTNFKTDLLNPAHTLGALKQKLEEVFD
jgi:hypothetical protein